MSPLRLAVFLTAIAPFAFSQTQPTVTLTTSANSSIAGQPVSLTATVTPEPPAASVTFYDGSKIVGTAAVSGGTATLPVILSGPEPHALRARLVGANFAANASPVVKHLVSSVPARTFHAAVAYTTENAIWQHIATADFNGDGHLDLVANNATILLGNGDGTFRQGGSYTNNTSSYAITVADFNHDGKPDFAAAAANGGVRIWLNNGDATFRILPAGAPDVGPEDLEAGDFNNDGIPDIAAACRQGSTTGLVIMIGVGDGTFHPAVYYLAGTSPSRLELADLNGDGNVDVLAAGTNTFPRLYVLMGSGDGTFQPGDSYTMRDPKSLAAGDFNRDGITDVTALGRTSSYLNNFVEVFLGTGGGSLSPQPRITPRGFEDSFSARHLTADLDGDGNPDIVGVASGTMATVYIGNGDGTFRGGVTFPAGTKAGAIAAGDFNGDGRIDLAVTNSSSVQVLLAGPGVFPSVTTTSVPDARGGVAYSFPLEATGGSTPYSWTLTTTGSIPLNVAGDGTLWGKPNTNISAGDYPFTVMAGGPDGPGFYSSQILSLKLAAAFLIDATTTSGGKVGSDYSDKQHVTGGTPPYRNWQIIDGALPPGVTLDPATGIMSGTPTTAGRFSLTLTVDDSTGITSLPATIALDIKGALAASPSSLPDVITGVAYYVPLKGSGGYGSYRNWSVTAGALPPGLSLDSASGAISGVAESASGSPYHFTVTFSDITNSASAPQPLTIAVVDPTPVSVTLSSSANPSSWGTSVTLTAALSVPGASGSVTFYDETTVLGTVQAVNSAASLTTALLSPGAHHLRARIFGAPWSPTLSPEFIQTMNAVPAGSFEAPVTYTNPVPPPYGSSIVTADWNADGVTDLITGGVILLGKGDGSFGQAISYSAASDAVPLGIGDFNEDGFPDLIAGPELQFFAGKGDGTFSAPATVKFGAIRGPRVLVADFNGDGHLDFLASGSYFYAGVGDGTFRPAATVESGLLAITDMAAGDFDRDGIPDIAIADFNSARISIERGNGNGTFSQPVFYSIPAGLSGSPGGSLVTGDLNRDGRTDLIAVSPFGDRLQVLLGQASASFTPVAEYSTGGNFKYPVMTDLNADGIPDLAAFDATTSTIAVVTGNGDGTFQAAANYTAGVGVSSLAAGEFNRDGRVDFAFLSNPGIGIVLSNAGTIATPLTVAPDSLNVTARPAAGDITKTVTLTYQSSSPLVPSFTASVVPPSTQWVYLPVSSGLMTLSSESGGIYTYSAAVDVAFRPPYSDFQKPASASIVFSVGGPPVTLAVSLDTSGALKAPGLTGVVNAASEGHAAKSVTAPGSYVAMYGWQLAGDGPSSATSLPLPFALNGAQATLGGLPMPLLYAADGQINALVPQSLAPGQYPLVLTNDANQTSTFQLTVKKLQPAIYTVDTSGGGPGIVTNALTGQLITPENPAHPGDYLVIYCTGLGTVHGPAGEPGPADGAAAPLETLYRTDAPVTAFIQGAPVTALFAGLTPTFAGLYQVNIQLPANTPAGDAVQFDVASTIAETATLEISNIITIAVR